MSTATLNDMSILATDVVFGNRVLESLIQYCTVSIPSESITDATAQVHAARKNLAAAIVLNPSNFKTQIVDIVSANQTVANDATSGGTLVGMTTTQVATAALNCTDTDISNAVASAFNDLIPVL